MKEALKFELVADRQGMLWDLLLYVPTVIALASFSAILWYGNQRNAGYLFFFLTCIFFIAGFNRIFKSRLMLLPASPVVLIVGQQSLGLVQKNGDQLNLVKNLKFFSDFAGKSFGISGQDGAGKQWQFVFNSGQFGTKEKFVSAQDAFKRQCQSN